MTPRKFLRTAAAGACSLVLLATAAPFARSHPMTIEQVHHTVAAAAALGLLLLATAAPFGRRPQ